LLRDGRLEPGARDGADAVRGNAHRHQAVAGGTRAEVRSGAQPGLGRCVVEADLPGVGLGHVPGARVAGPQQDNAQAHVARGADDLQCELKWLGVRLPVRLVVEVVEFPHAGNSSEGHF
jgi:hypothetical protein